MIDVPFLFSSVIFFAAGAWSASPLAAQNKINLRFMRHQLMAWGIVDEREATTATPIITRVMIGVAQLRAWGFFGIGIAYLLLSPVWVVIAILSTGDAEGFVPLSNTIINDFLWLGIFAGFTIGHVIGVWWLRRRARGQATYGDLHRRSIADYRAPIAGWLAPAMTVAWVVVTSFALPHLNRPFYPANVTGPDPLIAVFDEPSQMVVVTILAEILVRWIARLPRLLIIPDPKMAQRADDILRATTIGVLQSLQIILIGVMGSAQWNILNWHLPGTFTGTAFHLLLIVTDVYFFTGLAFYFFQGHIGGRLSGWPWGKPSRTVAGARADG